MRWARVVLPARQPCGLLLACCTLGSGSRVEVLGRLSNLLGALKLDSGLQVKGDSMLQVAEA